MNRRNVLTAGIALIAAAAIGGVWVANHGDDLFSRPPPPPDDQRLLAALDEPTCVDAPLTPLSDVLAELAQRHNVSLRCDEDALKTSGLTTRTPVTLHVEDVRLWSALNLLGRRISYYDSRIVIRENDILLTTRDVEDDQSDRVGRVYPITPLMFGDGPVNESRLADVIAGTIRRETWADAGGETGVIEVLPGGLAVAQTLGVHWQIEQLLHCLEQVAADETSTVPIDVEVWPNSGYADILRSLEEETSLEFIETPLADVCDDVADRHGIPIFVDYGALADVGLGGDHHVTARFAGIKLKGALNLLLHQLDLTFVICNEVLMITTPEEAERMPIVRLYPVRDLVDIPMPFDVEYDTLIELVMETIAPTTWVFAGDYGTIDGFAGCLIVSQTRRVHTEIESLLVRLRHRLEPYNTSPADDPVSPPVRRIEAALAETTEIKAIETRLYDVVDDLSKRHEVEIVIDDRGLEDIGEGRETPLSGEIVNRTLRQALDQLLRPRDLTFVVRHEVLLITTREEAKGPFERRLFDVRHLIDPDFGVTEVESLIDLIQDHVCVVSWNSMGGLGEIGYFQGILVVFQTEDVWGDLQALLNGLAEFQNSPDSRAPIAVTSPLDSGNDAICDKLEATVDLSLRGVPLNLAVERLARDYQLPISIRRTELHEVDITCDYPVWRTVRNMSLGAALEWILHEPDLTYCIRGGSVQITNPNEAERELSTRIYPVRDLVYYPSHPPTAPDGPQRLVPNWKGGASSHHDYDPLSLMVTDFIEPESWDCAGGRGSISPCLGGALVVSQTHRVHAEVERLLALIRHYLSPSTSPELNTPSIEETLATPVSIQSAGTPLHALLDQLGRRYNVTMILDTPAYQPIPLPKSFNIPSDVFDLLDGEDDPFGGADDRGANDPFGGGNDPFGENSEVPDDDVDPIAQAVVELARHGLTCVARVMFRDLRPWPDGAETADRWLRVNREWFRFEMTVARCPIHCDISNASLEEALRQILQPVGFVMVVRDEALWITTPENADSVLTVEVYDVRELTQVSRPSEDDDAAETLSYPDIGFYPNATQSPNQWILSEDYYASVPIYVDLEELVVEFVDPLSWLDYGGTGTATIYHDLLIVRQTRRGHERVRQLLSFLQGEAKKLPRLADLTNEPSQDDIESLVEYLRQADDPRQLAYVLHLIELTEPPAEDVVPVLTDMLAKLHPIDDAAKHQYLVYALCSFGRDAEEAVPLLVDGWRALPASHHSEMVYAIGRLGPATVPFLCEVLESQDESSIAAACNALQSIGPKALAAVDPLLGVFSDDAVRNRAIANALAAIDPEGILCRQAVARWATDPDQNVRERAAKVKDHVQSIFGDPY